MTKETEDCAAARILSISAGLPQSPRHARTIVKRQGDATQCKHRTCCCHQIQNMLIYIFYLNLHLLSLTFSMLLCFQVLQIIAFCLYLHSTQRPNIYGIGFVYFCRNLDNLDKALFTFPILNRAVSMLFKHAKQ